MAGFLEHGEFAAGEAQAVLDIGVDLVAGQPGEVVAHDEALAERFVHRHGEAPAQLGQPHEDEAHAVLGVHGEVGQQPQVLEHVAAQVVGLVDDEHGELLGLLGKAGDFGLDRVVGRGARALHGDAELPSDGLVHVEHVAGAQRDVVHAVQPRMELGGEVAAHGGLAGADLAGEHADALELDEVAESRPGLAPGGGLVQLVGLGRGLEGQAGEGEVAQVHQSSSLRSRRLSGEGGGCGAGSPVSTSLEWLPRLTAVLA